MARSEFKFAWPFRVRYSEVDGQRIVFNAHYLTYYDTAITEYFRALPYDYMGQVERTGEDYHTVRTLVEYQQPIEFDEDIEVLVRTSRLCRLWSAKAVRYLDRYARRKGKIKVKQAPCPAVPRAWMEPPCRVAILRQVASPTPAPG